VRGFAASVTVTVLLTFCVCALLPALVPGKDRDKSESWE